MLSATVKNNPTRTEKAGPTNVTSALKTLNSNMSDVKGISVAARIIMQASHMNATAHPTTRVGNT